MAVGVSIVRGHDASYPFKAIGAAEGPVITGERGAGYYLSAVGSTGLRSWLRRVNDLGQFPGLMIMRRLLRSGSR